MATRSRSSPSWRSSLAQTLARLQQPDRPARVAVVGIGNESLGDDAAGVAVARALRRVRNPPLTPSLLIIDAGTAPENFTGSLRRFDPDLVLMVDAAQMDQAPGAVRWLAGESVEGFGGSTHTLPLDMIAHYMQSEIGCEVVVLGIQPAHDSPCPFTPERGTHLSAAVRKAVLGVVSETRKVMSCSQV